MVRTAQDIIEGTESFSAHNYHPLPVVLTRGEGSWVWDVNGNSYLDMLSAYSAQNFGHCHPRIVSVMVEQAKKLAVTSRAFYTDKYEEFVRTITGFCHMDKVLPANGGAEAVETAIKISRKWGYENKFIEPESAEIIVCSNNFHGRTTTIVGFSTEAQNRNGFGPFTPGLKLISFGDHVALNNAITENTVAILVEPIQGEGGIIVPPDGYLWTVRNICNRRKILLVLDEIQTGMGRTGFNFAYQHDHRFGNAKPDILILGKALGGGMLPVSAVLARDEIMNVIKPGDHGSTFGGNPLACAVAIESINVLEEEGLTQKARELGGYFISELKRIQNHLVKEVRGRGLLVGLELVEDQGIGRRFCEAMLEEGILCKETRDNVVRFAPPLIIKRVELDWALERIERVLRSF